MTDNKKEVNMLLLGIVAILAIVGLVLLFSSPAATGKAFFPPPLPPSVETPAPVGYVPQQQVSGMNKQGMVSNAVIVSSLEGGNLPVCPNGRIRTIGQGNLPYEAIPGYLCNWFYCPDLYGSNDPAVQPVLACTQK